MDCEKVRDRFSSLWEKELSPFEEKTFKEHLSSCPECRREYEQFEKTMRWLHSVGEVKVPEGFLPELYKKIEEKKGALPGEKSRGRWFHFPLSFKLPVQAVAMVAIVFLVLYLTKMMPMEGDRLKEVEQTSSPLSVEKKAEQVLTPKEMEKERRALETSAETPHPKDSEQAKAPVLGGEKLETGAPQVMAGGKKAKAPCPQTPVTTNQAIDSREAGGVKTPSPEPRKIEKGLVAKEKSVMASKPPQEIVLRISDRKKGISELHELVEQFGGEMVTAEGDRFLASLPTSSFSQFKKELERLSSSIKTDQLNVKKHATGGLRFEQGVKREEGDEKSKGSAGLTADTESRTIVRILLVEE